MQFNEFRCPGCNLFFVADLEVQDTRFCPLCGHASPELVQVTETKTLCSECAGTGKRMTQAQLDELASEVESETSEFLNEDLPGSVLDSMGG
jgi:hypothetical protein